MFTDFCERYHAFFHTLFLLSAAILAVLVLVGSDSARADGFHDLFGRHSIHAPGVSSSGYRGPGSRAEVNHAYQAKGLYGVAAYASADAAIDPFPPARTVEKIGRSGSVHAMVTASAVKHGVPPALAHGVVKAESGYKCGAKNKHSTATGIMQVLDGTARGVGVHGNRRDCATGLEAGMRYLRQAYQRAGGNWCSAASLYNLGHGSRATCTGYGRRVVHLARL